MAFGGCWFTVELKVQPCRPHAQEVVWMTVAMVREAPVELPLRRAVRYKPGEALRYA
jgi:hypothetical protein